MLLPTVSAAFTALQGISGLAVIPSETFAELWPGAWKWMEFFHTYIESREALQEAYLDLHFDLVNFLHKRQRDRAAMNVLWKTPRVAYWLARTWVHLLRHPDSDVRDTASVWIFVLFMEVRYLADEPPIDSFVEATGGTVRDFVSTVIDHIWLVVPTRQKQLSDLDIDILIGLLMFVCHHGGHGLVHQSLRIPLKNPYPFHF